MIPLISQRPACHIVTATQDTVDALLEMNTHNRSKKQSHIEQMADEMRFGRWFLTNQGIGVTKSGWLCDGQNRLEAIKLAGYPPVLLLVVTGLDDEAQIVVDTHSRRKQADVITLVLNHTVSGHVVAAANVLLRLRNGANGYALSGPSPSVFMVSEFISENSELLAELMPRAGNLRAAEYGG